MTSSSNQTFISTPTFDREGILQTMSDYHKEAYGYRPRGIDYKSMSNEELSEVCARYSAVCKQNQIEEEEAQNQSFLRHEALITKHIEVGAFLDVMGTTLLVKADDRAIAIKWLYDASNCTQPSSEYYLGRQDLEFYVWNVGLFGTKEGNSLLEELFEIYHPNCNLSEFY